MDYKSTLHLPQTTFPMKAELPKREPEMQARWEKDDLYGKIRQVRRGSPKYVLHDGPPYANGDVHIGTGLNKILKDIVVKFKTMQGYDAPYIPGWDCHGLPIEHRVMNELGEKAKTLPKAEIRKLCEAYARKYIEIQKRQFKRLGVLGDWEHPYLTLDHAYEAAIVDLFSDLVDSGHVYRKLKPVHWCMRCQTALAEAELEYSDEPSPSIYVRFALNEGIEAISRLITPPEGAGHDAPPKGRGGVSLVIWTTTPWTLPANVATAVHPSLEYALVEARLAGAPPAAAPERMILAAGLVEAVAKTCGLTEVRVLGTCKGASLDGLVYRHPFLDRTCKVVCAEYVRLTDGTGCVHTAPGHGHEDYLSAVKYGLPIISPVDAAGTLTREAGIAVGRNVHEADDEICGRLAESKALLHRTTITHSYPHCWRCKRPVIFRATEQWFISVDHQGGRRKALDAIASTQWVPAWGQTRITSMVQDRPDWCVSRQRIWGVPIPAFYCASCGETLCDKRTITRVRNLFAKEGANAWFTKEPIDLLSKSVRCPKCEGKEFRKEDDIFDVWFESGSSHRAVCQNRPELAFPADLYLEGTDQHRGWFQLSLLPSVFTQKGQSPFKTVLTHGFVVLDTGEKVSKSEADRKQRELWEALLAENMAQKYGADLLRLWIASVNFTDDIPVSVKIIAEKGEAYLKIRNTFRYLLGNLHDFDPNRDLVSAADLLEIDRWALIRLRGLCTTVTKAMEAFEFHRAVAALHNFCAVELSSFYLDVLKDRLYTSAKHSRSRRAAQTVICEILITLAKMCAPVLAHTAEEVWALIPGVKESESVHLAHWPRLREAPIDQEFERTWDRLFKIRSDVARELEKLRASRAIGKSTEAVVTLATANEDLLDFMRSHEGDLPTLCLVAEVRIEQGQPAGATQGTEVKELFISVVKSAAAKCERCWNLRPDVGKSSEHPTLCGRCVDVMQTAVVQG
ncbi:MAG: isoleucine--tRNA ligase [Planctomycetes bacterium]|nr:isoleucine--tRNA ligase [Planctomycetota bacterium]